MQLNLELLEQNWVRDHFSAFCRWEHPPRDSGKVVARIDRYATYFELIDQHVFDSKEISQARLFDLFGAEALRRAHRIVSYLVDVLHLEWRDDAIADHADERRIQALLVEWEEAPWAAELRAYARDLQDSDQERTLRPKTRRVYLNAAARLLGSSGVGSIRTLTEENLESFLRRSPGQRACLAPFVRFSRDHFGVNLHLAKRPPTSATTSDRRLVKQMRELLPRIEQAETHASGRALLAKIIATTYQVSLKKVLRLTHAEVRRTDDGITLWPQSLGIKLAEPIDRHFRRWAAGGNARFVFLGRNGVQSLSYDAVRYHVK